MCYTDSMTKSNETFEQVELQALKAFYQGMQARKVRQKYCDPWPVVARHRALPEQEFQSVMAAAEKVKLDK